MQSAHASAFELEESGLADHDEIGRDWTGLEQTRACECQSRQWKEGNGGARAAADMLSVRTKPPSSK